MSKTKKVNKTKLKRKYIRKKKSPTVGEDKKISVIILSDLPGYRMKSYGPTPLIQLENKYLIDYQIEAIKKNFTNYEIILCVGFDTEKICKHIRNKHNNVNIRIVENQTFNVSNSCEGLRLSLNNTLNTNILILDGGLLFDKRVLSMIDINQNCTIIEQQPVENLEIGININAEKIAQYFSFGAHRVWSEIIYINDEVAFNVLRKFLNHQDSKKKFIFEAFNDILKNKLPIKCIENKYDLFKINNIKSYHNIKESYEIFNF